MGWKFYGHAAIFNTPDKDGSVFASSCFSEFLNRADYLSIPMLNAHTPEMRLGRWVRMHQDGYGLFVIGELNDNLKPLTAPFPGLSIAPANTFGSRFPSVWGGQLIRSTWIAEISLVGEPAHQATWGNGETLIFPLPLTEAGSSTISFIFSHSCACRDSYAVSL